MNTPSRRTLLANAPAVSVATLAGGAVTKALSAEPDPVFGAIEAHKAAMAANTAALNAKDEDAEDAALRQYSPASQQRKMASEDGTVLAFAFGADEDSPV
jgi:hypothetical protein